MAIAATTTRLPNMAIVLVESHLQRFGFCSQLCANRHRLGLPAISDERNGASNGCWLCGRDLLAEAN